ncbi:hypothetical protein DUNSADRAFT_2583 [Dunaliella salina]|uniref:Polycystin cation channel PKD1/PKD2 domain-containing protein n=1 Tax=Dunaliella salina TaxID=3046 RepID=A0ABQ7FW54_DUNSA|nr:hypothetical protein DUNSADRAFT_2583 [Dunaliella salina]|eukprot:KAF5826599.1 hypothetical protein DUNSADRAFT_2583 [Dunaliella salina]
MELIDLLSWPLVMQWQELVRLYMELIDLQGRDGFGELLKQQGLDYSDALRVVLDSVSVGTVAAGRISWFNESKTGASINECVESRRGGPFPRFHFSVGVNEGTQVPASELADDSSSAAFAASGTRRLLNRKVMPDTGDWSGYPVKIEGTTNTMNPRIGDLGGLYSTDRPVGIKGNQVLAGGMFMQERRMPADLARGGSRFASVCEGGILAAKLAAECLELHTASAEADLAYWDKQEADHPSGRKWIGVDPTFIPNSPLYNPSIAMAPWGWYNTSLGSADLNPNGVPHGFESFPGGLPGLPDDHAPIFPVVVDINAGGKQTRHTLQYMKEGRYFSRMASTRMLFKIASFNVDLQLFGYLVADARWDDAGQVQVSFDVQGLEAKDYTPAGLVMEGMRDRLVNDLVLLVFVVAYTIATIRDINLSLQAQRSRKHTWLALRSARKAFQNYVHGSSSSSISGSRRSERLSSLPISSNTLDEMLIKEEADSDDSFDSPPETNLRLDDTQVNDHPIPAQRMRIIRFTRKAPSQQLDLARSSMGSETSSGQTINSIGSRAVCAFHGMKRLMRQPEHKIYRVSKSPFWIFYEIVTSLTLLFGLALTLYYAFGLQPEEAPTERRFKVYDFLYATARPFLLSRSAPDQNATELAMQFDMNVREPGQFGRWETGTEEARGLVEMAQMFNQLDQMVTVRTAYTLIFGAAMVLLLVGLMVQVSFQPRLSLIAGTLVLGAAEICNFVFIATVLCAMLAMAQNIVFGADSHPMSTLSGSMKLLFEGLVLGDQGTGDSKEAMAFLRRESVVQLEYSPSFVFDTNPGLMALAAIIISVRPMIFMFLIVMVMTTLAIPYAMLRAGASAAPGVHTDIFNVLSWVWKIVTDRQPDNLALKRMLKLLLKEGPRNVQDQPSNRKPPLLKLLTKSKQQNETPSSTRSLAKLPEARKAEVYKSAREEGLDWSHLHSLLTGELEDAPGTTSMDGSGTGNTSMEPSASQAGVVERDTPRTSMAKSAQLKMWVAGLRKMRRNSKPANPAPGPGQASTSGNTGDDVEFGTLKQAHIRELASVTVNKALHQATAVKEATGSRSSPFRNIDFMAAKKQIAGLLSLQEDQREQAAQLAQRMSMMFSATTEAISTKANLVTHAQQASQTELVRAQRQDARLRQRTGNATHRGLWHPNSLWDPLVCQPAANSAPLPSTTSGGIAVTSGNRAVTSGSNVPWDNTTELWNAVFDTTPDRTDPSADPLVCVGLQSASFTSGQVFSVGEDNEPAATEISFSPTPADLVEELINLTLEANAALREVQATCSACAHLADSVSAMLCEKTKKEGKGT